MKPSMKPLGVVTGASSGIGFELARQFIEHGYDLIVTADSDRINDAASRLEAIGGNIYPMQADLSRPEGIDKLYS